MKISIDTKEDSADDLKKVVKMLEALLEGHVAAPFNMFGDLSPSSGSSNGSAQSPGADLFSIFDDKDAQNSQSSVIKSDDKKDDDVPEIIPY